uniref:Secreted protein n=2 Tax=Mesocestoides corti TaxID=53468 RepID=A0A5K3G389_MESCO
MALEVTLTSVVAAIVVWAVQVENGGVLNTVFKVVPTTSPSGTVEFDLSDNLMQSNIDYLMSMLL